MICHREVLTLISGDDVLEQLKREAPESIKLLEDLEFIWNPSAGEFIRWSRVFQMRISADEARKPIAELAQHENVIIASRLMRAAPTSMALRRYTPTPVRGRKRAREPIDSKCP